MWRGASVKRILVVGAAVAALAFLLLLFLASLGDSGLPPYNPPFLGERVGWIVYGVMSWPLSVAAFLLRGDPPFMLWPPLMFLGGLSWAAVIEAALLSNGTRRV